jgi:hypothetical protein
MLLAAVALPFPADAVGGRGASSAARGGAAEMLGRCPRLATPRARSCSAQDRGAGST